MNKIVGTIGVVVFIGLLGCNVVETSDDDTLEKQRACDQCYVDCNEAYNSRMNECGMMGGYYTLSCQSGASKTFKSCNDNCKSGVCDF